MQGNNEEDFKELRFYLALNGSLDSILPHLLFIRSYSAFPLGKSILAIDDCESSYAIFRVMEKPMECARSANFLGMLNRSNSDYREALKWYQRAMTYYSRANLLRKQSMVHLNIGSRTTRLAITLPRSRR